MLTRNLFFSHLQMKEYKAKRIFGGAVLVQVVAMVCDGKPEFLLHSPEANKEYGIMVLWNTIRLIS